MQLKLSLAAAALLSAAAAQAEDYINVQYMYYDENSGTTVSTPMFEINKDFGTDDTVNFTFTHDTVSGASPTWYDSSTGASSVVPPGTVDPGDLAYDYLPYDDRRQAYALSYTHRFASRDQLTVGGNYSDENDYTAREISAEYLLNLDRSRNRTLSLGVSWQHNDVTAFCGEHAWVCDGSSGGSPKVVTKNLDVVTAQVGFTQILDSTSVAKISLFYIGEDGYLSNPYMNVVRDYDTGNPFLAPERKPDSRTAWGTVFEYSKALDRLAVHLSYRFYDDDWEIRSHTFDGKAYYTLSPAFTVGAGLRYYTQSAADFYHAGKDCFTDEKYASSDRRMSEFDATDYNLGGTWRISDTVSVNANVDYYIQYDHFDAMYYNIGFRYLF